MNFYFTPEQQKWKFDVQAFLQEEVTDALLQEIREREPLTAGPLEQAFTQQVIARDWNKIDLPKSLGGLALTEMEKYIFMCEVNRYQAPYFVSSITSMVSNAIDCFGTNENKQRFLPAILAGEMSFALGYSEPNAGTDLANLTTTARRDGDEWVINGQKTWNTVGHRVTHQWLLARTGDATSRHQGLSMFLVPMDAEGVAVSPIQTWGEHTTNDIFLDQVCIPLDHLIGEENDGWRIVNFALDLERITIGDVSIVERMLEEAIIYACTTTLDAERLIDNPIIATRLVEAEITLEIGTLLGYEVVTKLDQRLDVSADAAMIKVYGSELKADVASLAMEIAGAAGQLNWQDQQAPYDGFAEHQFRLAPFYRFGGGTNEVQRNIIAQRGLNLPRH